MTLVERAWQAGANLAAAATRLVPRRARYPLALRLARITLRWLGPTLMKRPQRYLFSSVLDETIRVLLRVMARHGIAFDPNPRLCVPPDLNHGAIFVGAHFPLNAMATRFLHDRGFRPLVLLGIPDGSNFIWGTSEPLACITPGPAVLVTLRDRLREGHAIVMVLDRADREERTQLVETALGTIPIATPIFEFAKRMAVPLYWICARTDETGEPVVYIERIEPSFDAYAALLREHAAQLKL